MSPDLIAEVARIQHSERVNASVGRLQYVAVDDEPRTATTRRSSSFTRRVLATAAITLGLGAGALNVVSSLDGAANASQHVVVASHHF